MGQSMASRYRLPTVGPPRSTGLSSPWLHPFCCRPIYKGYLTADRASQTMWNRFESLLLSLLNSISHSVNMLMWVRSVYLQFVCVCVPSLSGFHKAAHLILSCPTHFVCQLLSDKLKFYFLSSYACIFKWICEAICGNNVGIQLCYGFRQTILEKRRGSWSIFTLLRPIRVLPC